MKKNRALPFYCHLLDENGNILTDADIATSTVLQVMFNSGFGDPVDVSDDATPQVWVKKGTASSKMQPTGIAIQVKAKNYTKPGTYNMAFRSVDAT